MSLEIHFLALHRHINMAGITRTRDHYVPLLIIGFTTAKQTSKEEFEDTKGIIRICKSQKDRQHNGHMKKNKRTNNDLQNIHIKLKIESNTNATKNRGWTQVFLKGKQLLLHKGTRRVTLVTNPVISHEWGKDRKVFSTSGAYPWSFVTQMFRSG